MGEAKAISIAAVIRPRAILKRLQMERANLLTLSFRNIHYLNTHLWENVNIKNTPDIFPEFWFYQSSHMPQ